MQSVHHEVQIVRARASENRDLSRHGKVAEGNGAHVRYPSLRVDGTDTGHRYDGDARNLIVGGQPDTVPVAEAEDATVLIPPRQRKPRRQSDRIGTGHRSLKIEIARLCSPDSADISVARDVTGALGLFIRASFSGPRVFELTDAVRLSATITGTTSHRARWSIPPYPTPLHSHSIVPGGLLVTSYTTRLTPFTSLMMRVATPPMKAMSKA